MIPVAWEAFLELKGYVDACVDAYQDAEGIPFSTMETIQKRIETIAKVEDDAGKP